MTILAPEEVVGDGPESVYVYFSESERRLARLEGRDCWPCKVGFTAGDSVERIRQQGTRNCFQSSIASVSFRGGISPTECPGEWCGVRGQTGPNTAP